MKMIGLETYGGKSKVSLGFFLLVSYVPLVRSMEYSSLNATTLSNECSTYFAPDSVLSVTGVDTPGEGYYPSSKYAFPIDPEVTWMANRNSPLSSAKALMLHPNGTLELPDQNPNSPQDMCYNMDFGSAKLQYSGKLVLKNINGTEAWKGIDYSTYPPTGMLLPGQSIVRGQCSSLISWQEKARKPPTAIFLSAWPDLSNITSTLKQLTMSGNVPTVALHGTDRISYLRSQVVEKLPEPPAAKKDSKWVKILASIVGILGVLLIIVVAIFCLRRYENVQQWLRACGLCFRRPKPRYEIQFPGDTPVRTEAEDGGGELEMEERGPRCHCAVSCVMSCKWSDPEI